MSCKAKIETTVVDGFPLVVSKLLKFSPLFVVEGIMSKSLNAMFRPSIENGDLDFFNGKLLNVCVTDLGFSFCITSDENGFRVVHHYRECDLYFSGESYCFMLLMTDKVDPDMLFFQRKIKITGDTDLGLEIKNTLANVDVCERIPALLSPFFDRVSNEILASKV